MRHFHNPKTFKRLHRHWWGQRAIWWAYQPKITHTILMRAHHNSEARMSHQDVGHCSHCCYVLPKHGWINLLHRVLRQQENDHGNASILDSKVARYRFSVVNEEVPFFPPIVMKSEPKTRRNVNDPHTRNSDLQVGRAYRSSRPGTPALISGFISTPAPAK